MSNELEDFQQFMQQREEIARAYVQGDAAPINSIVTHNAPATFFGPGGGRVEGPKKWLPLTNKVSLPLMFMERAI